MPANNDPSANKRLDSWKEIAGFFDRGERTVKRWETERGLPVHRVPGRRGVVFAYRDELTEWLKGSGTEGDAEAVEGEGPRSTAEMVAVVDPASRLRRPGRGALWLAPIAVLGILAIVFYAGQRGLRFKAMASPHQPNAEAQDFYLKGRYYWNRRTPEDLNKAVDYFTQAIVKDPGDAAAYVGLADCYNLLREFGAMSPADAYPRALAAAQRAVELDESSAEAHNSLAFVTFWWSWRGATAEREFKRALQLNPTLVRAHHWYATSLVGMHRYPEALDQLEQARKLEPSSTAILADKGYALWFSGQQSEGLALLQQLEVTEPTLSSTHDYLARIDWDRKAYPEALQERKRSAELRLDEAALAIANVRIEGFSAGGLSSMWERALPVQKEYFERGLGSAYSLAEACAALGKKQEAIGYLRMAFDRRESGMLRLRDDEIWGPLRGDAGFEELATKVRERLRE